MANVLVYIRTEGVRANPHSLQTLGEARRIASTLGGSLYAFVATSEERDKCGPLIDELADAGADQVAVAIGDSLAAAPPSWSTLAAAFDSAVERVRPRLALLTADSVGRDIGPRLAARMSAGYYAEPAIHYGSHGEVVLSRTVFGRTHRLRLSAEELHVAAVATLTPGSYRQARGSEEAEVLFLDIGDPPPAPEFVESAEDAGAALEEARVVVTAGGGCTEADLGLIAELAEVLGGESGVTRSGFEAGLGSRERIVDVAGRSVAPMLYISFGASGSMEHLGAVASDAEIVAINSDPKAPIFRVATYGLIGTISEILPALVSEARGRAT